MKYTMGDYVTYEGKKCKVVTGWKNKQGVTKYRIEVLEPEKYRGTSLEVIENKLKPTEYDFSPPIINPHMVKSKYWNLDPEVECPICGKAWTVTQFNSKKWYDCLTCKRTKEQIMKGR
jgi:hypothetical protein